MAIARKALPRTKTPDPKLAQGLTAFALAQCIVEIAVCADCGAHYLLRQVGGQCYSVLRECPVCNQWVRGEGLFADSCPNCSTETRIILGSWTKRCQGRIVQVKDLVRVEAR